MRNELDNLIRNMMSMTPLQRITMARCAKTRIERYAMKMGLDKEKALSMCSTSFLTIMVYPQASNHHIRL